MIFHASRFTSIACKPSQAVVTAVAAGQAVRRDRRRAHVACPLRAERRPRRRDRHAAGNERDATQRDAV